MILKMFMMSLSLMKTAADSQCQSVSVLQSVGECQLCGDLAAYWCTALVSGGERDRTGLAAR